MWETTEPAGSRGRPPRIPPGAVAGDPAPLPPPTPRGRSRIVCFSGPEAGVGQTSIALNLSLAWAGIQSRNVVVVESGRVGRGMARFLGIEPVPFRGLDPSSAFPLGRWGIGVLRLDEDLDADGIRKLTELSGGYDLFLDAGPLSGFRAGALLLADLVFWVCLPRRSHFEVFGASPGAVEVVVNRCGMPGAMGTREIGHLLLSLRRTSLCFMPHDGELVRLAEQDKVFLVERPSADWSKALRPLLGRVMAIPRKDPPPPWP